MEGAFTDGIFIFSMQSTQAPKSSLRFLPLPVLSHVEGVEITEA